MSLLASLPSVLHGFSSHMTCEMHKEAHLVQSVCGVVCTIVFFIAMGMPDTVRKCPLYADGIMHWFWGALPAFTICLSRVIRGEGAVIITPCFLHIHAFFGLSSLVIVLLCFCRIA